MTSVRQKGVEAEPTRPPLNLPVPLQHVLYYNNKMTNFMYINLFIISGHGHTLSSHQTMFSRITNINIF